MSALSAEAFLPQLDAGKPEVIVSAALYLMSSYGCSGGCPKLAHVIVRRVLTAANVVAKDVVAEVGEMARARLADSRRGARDEYVALAHRPG